MLEFLKKHKGKWFTAKQINNYITEIGISALSDNLKGLRRARLVNYRFNGFKEWEYNYKDEKSSWNTR